MLFSLFSFPLPFEEDIQMFDYISFMACMTLYDCKGIFRM